METKDCLETHSKRQGSRNAFRQGIKAGIPIGMGYFAVSFTLGITARNAGLTPWQAMVMSMLLHASAGQFAAIHVIAFSAGFLEMAVTSLIVNLRYLLLSSSLSQKVSAKTKGIHRYVMSILFTSMERLLLPRLPGRSVRFWAPAWEISCPLPWQTP